MTSNQRVQWRHLRAINKCHTPHANALPACHILLGHHYPFISFFFFLFFFFAPGLFSRSCLCLVSIRYQAGISHSLSFLVLFSKHLVQDFYRDGDEGWCRFHHTHLFSHYFTSIPLHTRPRRRTRTHQIGQHSSLHQQSEGRLSSPANHRQFTFINLTNGSDQGLVAAVNAPQTISRDLLIHP